MPSGTPTAYSRQAAAVMSYIEQHRADLVMLLSDLSWFRSVFPPWIPAAHDFDRHHRTGDIRRAVRWHRLVRSGDQGLLEREIPLPGLPNVQSQLVIPLVVHDDPLGILCLQSE